MTITTKKVGDFMTRTNSDIRSTARKAGVYLWQVAAELGINDGNFSRKLRKELSAEEKANIYAIIARLSAKEENEND